MVASAALLPPTLEGRTLGRYTLRYLVARGGMATVYLAQLAGAHGFEKWVAIKIMHPHLGHDRRFVTMFLDEARVASRIQHPNACSVLDFGEEGGMPYIVMEYMHGETLGSVVRQGWTQGDMPLWVPARIIADASRGLHAAHETRGPTGEPLQVVHRDVSPQNILALYDGIGKIMDFGVARAEGRMTDTATSEVKGKFAYMSPEQLSSKPIDRRSDVWALGVVLWETTLGRRLFQADSQGETLMMVMQANIPHPREINPDYPEALAAVAMEALVRDPARRTPSAKSFADGLERYLHGTGELVGSDRVADWMTRTFAEKRERREGLLQQARPGNHQDNDLSLVIDQSGQNTLDVRVEHPPSSRPTQPRGRLQRWMVALAIVAAALIGAGVMSMWSGHDSDTESVGREGAGTTLGTAARIPDTANPPAGEAPPATAVDGAEGAANGDEHGVAGVDANRLDPAAPASTDALPDDGSDPQARPTSGAAAPARTPTGNARSTGTGTGPSTPTAGAPGGGSTARDRPATSRRNVGTGTLNLLAIPAAEVRLGGAVLGRTPLIGKQLPAGRHRLTLTPIGGGASRTVTVTIRDGERTSQSVSLAATD